MRLGDRVKVSGLLQSGGGVVMQMQKSPEFFNGQAKSLKGQGGASQKSSTGGNQAKNLQGRGWGSSKSLQGNLKSDFRFYAVLRSST